MPDKIEKSSGYFVIAPNLLFDKYTKMIGVDAVYLYLYLLRRRGSGNTAFPSYARIREDTGMGTQRISKIIKVLEEFKFIVKVRSQSSNRYFINDKKLMAMNIKYYENEDFKKENFKMPNLPDFDNSNVETTPDNDSQNPGLPDQKPTPSATEDEDRNNKKETKERDEPPALTEEEQLNSLVKKSMVDWLYDLRKTNGTQPIGSSNKGFFINELKHAVEIYKDQAAQRKNPMKLIDAIKDWLEEEPFWSTKMMSWKSFPTIYSQFQTWYEKQE